MSLPRQKNNFILTDLAAAQIKVIKENDYTLEDCVFRLKIGGKGCSGFTYETGFGQALPDDIVLEMEFAGIGIITLHMDPFTHYYAHAGKLDYQIDPDTHKDGFVFDNFNENLYQGKFFQDESLLPPSHLEIS